MPVTIDKHDVNKKKEKRKYEKKFLFKREKE